MRCLVLFVIYILYCNLLVSQVYDYAGTVIDSDSHEPLIGVYINVKNSDQGTTTDFEGRFVLKVNKAHPTLTISYLGYQDQEIKVNSTEPIVINLQQQSNQLDEIVITGLGISRQKRELGYSTDNINGDAIAISNAPNVINALAGRSAGVNIVNSNGVEGGTTRITIRGNNNIKGNNQPLIILDGVPIENPPGLTSIGRGTDWGSVINNLNADDIEDINILKGPTASAKYGMRGANGVVLITTKKGQSRRGIGIQYTQTLKVIQPSRFRKVQNTFGAGGPISLLEPKFNLNADGELEYPKSVHTNNGPFGRPTTEQFGFYSTGVSWGPRMEGQMVRWWDGELRPYNPQPDNLKQYFKTGYTKSHNINFSKAADFGSLRISISRQEHDAVIPNSEFTNTTFNLGSEINISSKLKSTVSLSIINFERKNSPSLGDDNNASFGKGILYSWPRSYKGLEEELNINEDGSRYNYDGNYPFSFTPTHLWWNTANQNTYFDRHKLVGSVGLEYKINNWLFAKTQLGLDLNFEQFEERFNPTDIGGINEAKYSNELVRNEVLNNEFLIVAHKDRVFSSDIDLSLSVGGTQWSRSQYGINATTNRWINPWLFSFNNFSSEDLGNLPTANEIRFDKKINSLYAFANISFKDYLFVEVSGRNDWSSALPINNNSYFYPSASVSFILSEAIEMPWSWLSFAKLRASYAQTASDTDPFLLDFIYNIGSFGGQQTASLPDTKPPTELRPQQAYSYEAGLSLGAFNDRLNLDFTYYYIRSFDQILDSPIPSSSGAQNIRINNGTLENYGFEFNLEAYPLQWKQGYLNVGLILSQNKNFVNSLGDGAEFLELAEIWGDFGPKIMVRENEQYGTIYGFDHIYNDNGQPILNDEGTHYLTTENLVPIGNSAPKMTGGLTLDIKLNRLSISTLVDTRIGGDIYAGSHVIGLQTGQSPSTLHERKGNGLPYVDPEGNTRNIGVILPGVLQDGSTNDQVVHYYYKYLPNAGGWGKILTTAGVLNNTWIKMRELSLQYDLSTHLERLKFVQNCSASIVGRDLFYFYSSLPDNVNPEGSGGSGNAQGLEWASFPNMRSISFRLSITL